MADASAGVLDHVYLKELTEWVGQAILADLAAQAPSIFGLERDAFLVAWHGRDPAELRSAAHRLKGMAASLACCRLARLCQSAQHDPAQALVDTELGARLDRELAAALAALALHFPRQP